MKLPLVPIDGSPQALRALCHALDGLKGAPARALHLVNVQPPLIQPWPDKLVSPDMIDNELRQRGRELLAEARRLAVEDGTDVSTHVHIGSAAEEIVECARTHGCDAIVMGTRGRGAVAGLVLGSVAQRVVHLADVPVTLVK